jgi:hypothetical protein
VRVCLISILFAVGVAACGGDDRGEWAKEANALCEQLEQRVAGISPRSRVEDPEDLAPCVREVVAAARDRLGQMRDLEPAGDDEQRVGEMLDLYEESFDIADEAATTVETGDEAGYHRLLRQSDAVSLRADAIARELGAETSAFPLSV